MKFYQGGDNLWFSLPLDRSVNDGLSGEEYWLIYFSKDGIVQLYNGMKDPYMCKVDLLDAFVHCMICLQDRHLLGFTWENTYGEPRILVL